MLTGTTDPIGHEVSLNPTDAPNGDYASLDENDELVVDLTSTTSDAEGLNDGSITELASVFEIRYTGDQYAHVWITHESDAITFTTSGQPIQSESNNVTLGSNESVPVGLVVDTTGDTTDGLIDEIQVHAKVADPPVDDGSSDDGSDDSGSSDGGSYVSSSDGDDDVRVRTTSDGTTTDVTVENAPGGEPVDVDFDHVPIDGEDLTLDSMSVTREGGGDVEFAATGSPDPFGNDSLSVVGAESLGYLRVDHDAADGELSGVTFEFSVSEAYLEDRGVDPANLAVFRRPDGADGWAALDAEVEDGRDGRLRVRVESPGFSTFAVAERDPAFRVTGTDAADSEVTAGDADTPTEQRPTGSSTGEATDEAGAGDERLPGEPAAFGLSEALGLLGLLAVLGTATYLVRRVSRP